jgi:hypothetical protein
LLFGPRWYLPQSALQTVSGSSLQYLQMAFLWMISAEMLSPSWFQCTVFPMQSSSRSRQELRFACSGPWMDFGQQPRLACGTPFTPLAVANRLSRLKGLCTDQAIW